MLSGVFAALQCPEEPQNVHTQGGRRDGVPQLSSHFKGRTRRGCIHSRNFLLHTRHSWWRSSWLHRPSRGAGRRHHGRGGLRPWVAKRVSRRSVRARRCGLNRRALLLCWRVPVHELQKGAQPSDRRVAWAGLGQIQLVKATPSGRWRDNTFQPAPNTCNKESNSRKCAASWKWCGRAQAQVPYQSHTTLPLPRQRYEPVCAIVDCAEDDIHNSPRVHHTLV